MRNSIALSLLLGFELSYYLLIVQTGIVAHYNSDLITLFPMFAGGVLGTIFAGKPWIKYDKAIHKIIFALSLQLLLSFSYPNYNFFTLGLLGISVGMMAPLGIYLFKAKQQKELLFALALAYTIGTYSFTSVADSREIMAITLTSIALISAYFLKNYEVDTNSKDVSHTMFSYLPLVLWILLDSNLFETISRHSNLDIWSKYTYTIIFFHIFGLMVARKIDLDIKQQHKIIGLLFFFSYMLSYIEFPLLLAIIYPFTISYYNVIVFTTLSKELSLARLSFIMIFVGWIASGLGLALALSHLLH